MPGSLSTLNRRRFLAATSFSLGALALRGYPVLAAAPVHFTHGIASGDPLQDRVILWTRVLPGSGEADMVSVDWELARDEDFAEVVSRGQTQTGPDRDYTVKVDATGLEPGQRYFYRFLSEGIESPVGRTRTLMAGGLDDVRLAVVSCSNFPQGYFNVYHAIAERELDAVVHLGDYIYEYGADRNVNPLMEGKGRRVKPEHEILSLEDYRMRYGLYRSDADLQAVHQAHPFICVWDDHEISNNTWKTGAENHNEGEGDFFDRRRVAIQAFYEWLPIREQSSIEEGRIYRSFEFGDLASLIMLDTRLIGRDQQLTHDMGIDVIRSGLADEGRSIMGREQEQWLAAELEKSKGAGKPWQIIGQQLLMGRLNAPQLGDEEFDPAQLHSVLSGRYGMLRTCGRQGLPYNLDAWDGYPACRARVYEAIKAHASNAVVLAGDSHSTWAFDLHDDAGHPVAVEFATPSVTSSGYENLVPQVPEARVAEATLEASPELQHMKANGRGWLELEVSSAEVAATWRYVSTIVATEFEVLPGARLVTKAGEHLIERKA